MFNNIVRLFTLVLLAQGAFVGGLWVANILGVPTPPPVCVPGDHADPDCVD